MKQNSFGFGCDNQLKATFFHNLQTKVSFYCKFFTYDPLSQKQVSNCYVNCEYDRLPLHSMYEGLELNFWSNIKKYGMVANLID